MDDRPWAKNNDDHDDDVHDGDGDDNHFFHLGISNISHQPPKHQDTEREAAAESAEQAAKCRMLRADLQVQPGQTRWKHGRVSIHMPPGSILVLTYTLVN